MEQLGNELKKVLKAGMGAVAAGLEMGQDAIEQLAKKGEPLYEQAKNAVADAAGKVKQTIDSLNAQPQAQEIIDALRGMGKEAWDQVRAALNEFEAQAAEAEQAAKDAGYTDIYSKSLITLTAFEKLMGKDTFQEVLGPYVTKPKCKLTLVPVTDKRPEVFVNTVQDDFNE